MSEILRRGAGCKYWIATLIDRSVDPHILLSRRPHELPDARGSHRAVSGVIER